MAESFAPEQVMKRFKLAQEVEKKEQVAKDKERLVRADVAMRKMLEEKIDSLKFPIHVSRDERREMGYGEEDDTVACQDFIAILSEWNDINPKSSVIYQVNFRYDGRTFDLDEAIERDILSRASFNVELHQKQT